MPDAFTKAKGAATMARIRWHGNKDTDVARLTSARGGWRRGFVARWPEAGSPLRGLEILGDLNPGRRSQTRFALGYHLSGFQPLASV